MNFEKPILEIILTLDHYDFIVFDKDSKILSETIR